MKKILLMAALSVTTMPLAAQETYENAKIAQEDLNGTARYVGMGGAMEALGADISTISTNPAGIGMFRKSNISASFGLVSQSDVSNAVGGNKTNASFDQIGVVISTRMAPTSYLNFGFNFHKSRNFDMILSASSSLNKASLNKLTYNKGVNELVFPQEKGVDIYKKDADGKIVGYNHRPDFNRYPYFTANQLDDMLAADSAGIGRVSGCERLGGTEYTSRFVDDQFGTVAALHHVVARQFAVFGHVQDTIGTLRPWQGGGQSCHRRHVDAGAGDVVAELQDVGVICDESTRECSFICADTFGQIDVAEVNGQV